MKHFVFHLLGFCCLICFHMTQGSSTADDKCTNSFSRPLATCQNIPGGYHCTCKNGFKSSSGEEHFGNPTVQCIDVNECNQTPSPCGSNAICNNISGRYTCRCSPGYESDNNTCWRPGLPMNCRDVDECAQDPTLCGPHASCTNTNGIFVCKCLNGYVSTAGASGKPGIAHLNCTDTDECSQDPPPCGDNSLCINTPGSYVCTCPPGYLPTNQPGILFSCRDVDECSQKPSCCGSGSFCTNIPGSFICRCFPGGFSPNGTSWSPGNPHTSNCTEKIFSCQPRIPEGISLEGNCNTTTLPGKEQSNQICEFRDTVLKSLKSTWGHGNQTVLLKNISTSLYSGFNAFSQLHNQSKEDVTLAATTLLWAVESVALSVALRSKEKTQNVSEENLTIVTQLITDNCSQVEIIKLKAQEELMNIDCTAVLGSGAVAFISYASLESILNTNVVNQQSWTGGDAQCSIELNSKVVSGTIGNHGPLSKRFNLTLKHKQGKKTEDNITCVYWNSTEGTWSPAGCWTLDTNSTHTTCSCDHLSSFALLMVSHDFEDSKPLRVITYVGLTISLLCLFLAILTFLLCRSIWNVSTSIHLQLSLCLFLADLLFLTGVDRPNNKKACAVIAGFLHYLYLACFTWMFLEGLHLFLTVRNLKVVNYTSANRFKKRYMYPFGYGFPALIVVISAAVNHEGYGTSKHCWLAVKSGFIWSFLGPVCFIILINVSFFITILWILREKISSLNTNVSTVKNTRLLTFKAIAQLFILGCTWSFGLLQMKSAGMFMAYLFTIINTLQGVFIFLVHCLLNQQVREQYKKWIRRTEKPSTKSQSSGLSMSVVPTITGIRGLTEAQCSRSSELEAERETTYASWEKTS